MALIAKTVTINFGVMMDSSSHRPCNDDRQMQSWQKFYNSRTGTNTPGACGPQPRGWPWHSSKQIFRYAAQSGPINSGADGVTCWVPAIGGIGGGALRFTHTPKLFWHEAAHPVWTIFIFGMGVTLPAKLVAIEENRIIAATLSFICSPKG